MSPRHRIHSSIPWSFTIIAFSTPFSSHSPQRIKYVMPSLSQDLFPDVWHIMHDCPLHFSIWNGSNLCIMLFIDLPAFKSTLIRRPCRSTSDWYLCCKTDPGVEGTNMTDWYPPRPYQSFTLFFLALSLSSRFQSYGLYNGRSPFLAFRWISSYALIAAFTTLCRNVLEYQEYYILKTSVFAWVITLSHGISGKQFSKTLLSSCVSTVRFCLQENADLAFITDLDETSFV